MGVRTVVVGWELQFINVLLAAVNPGTYSHSCIALLEKWLTIRRKLSELIALVDSLISAELLVAIEEVSVNISAIAVVETISGLSLVAKAVMPGVIKLAGISITLYLAGISPCSFVAPILISS